MTKREQIEIIEKQFKNLTSFFKWIGYINAAQKSYQYRNCSRVEPAYTKLLDYFTKIKTLQNGEL